MTKPQTMQRFWFVWNPYGRNPTYRHPTQEAAVQEARRLAGANPGQSFIVLKAVGGFVAPEPEPEPIGMVAAASDDDDDIPF